MCVACGILVSQPGGELGYPAGEQGILMLDRQGIPCLTAFYVYFFPQSAGFGSMVNSILQHGGWPLVDFYLRISQLLPLEDFFTAALVNLKKKNH